ncbi:carboxypeptidase regulatory-like domain-containing protein [Agromyces sp. MMS24-K17]|uniref:carboxypeptidase regulatory-like domain-containing protein n=1 Tax=Agromyces sp. MMS24-K17 TaxID=3372850 RepID=UPI003754D3EA
MTAPALAPPTRPGRRLLGGLAALATVLGLAGFAAPAAHAAEEPETGSITGVVTGAAGAPLDGVLVQLFHCDADFDPTQQSDCWTLLWADGQSGRTAADGSFAIDGLEPGTYRAAINPQWDTAQYVREYWDGADLLEDATDITVQAGAAATIAPTLEVGATVSGTVTDAAGAPVAGGYVYAYLTNDLTGTRGGASVASDGSYSIPGLPTGEYVLKAGKGWGATSELVDEYWQDAYTLDAATRVDLTAGDTFTAAFELNDGGAVTGTVVDDDGAPVAGVDVTAEHAGSAEHWIAPVTATTGADGSYRLGGLEPGDYTVGFTDFDGTFGQQYWQGATDRSAATPVAVEPGVVVEDIDASLAPGGSLSGALTELADGESAPADRAYFDVLRKTPAGSWERVTSGTSAADGTYAVAGLAPGEYTVQSFGSSSGSWAWTYHGGAFYAEDATAVAVAASAETDGVDVETPPGVTLAGTIIDEHGGPATGARLSILFEREPGLWVAPPPAGGAGDEIAWQSGGLPPGDYVVKAEDDGTSEVPYATQYWEHAATQAEATVIEAPNGGRFDGIDLVMSRVVAPEPAPVPTVTGVAQVGQALTVDAGDWGAGAELAYRWLADGAPVAGATAAEYVPADAQAGAVVTVEVTGIRPGAEPLVATSAPSAALLPRFADVTGTGAHAANVKWAGINGVIDGVRGADGVIRFQPTGAATRATIAEALYRLAGSPAFTLPAKPSYADVPASHPSFRAIEWFKREGLTTVTGSFGPSSPLKRQELAAFLYRAADVTFTAPAKASFTDVPKGSSFYREIEWLKAERITTVSGTFGPTTVVTREHLATFLQRWDAVTAD